MKEFEEIAHSGGKIIINDDGIKYENTNPIPLVMYDIMVSFNGIILGRGNFYKNDPEPSIRVMIASDREGFFGYTCPRCKKYFRAKMAPSDIFCTYCLYFHDALYFLTINQLKYIKLYYKKYMEFMVTGKETIVDFDAIVNSLDSNVVKLNSYEEKMQLILSCQKCKLTLDIIGKYAGCLKCAERNYLPKFCEQLDDIKNKKNKSDSSFNDALSETIEVYSGLGSDVKYVLEQNIPLSQVNKTQFKKINFQRINETHEILSNLFGLPLYPNNEIGKKLNLMFQRRHIIAHNGAIVDQKYLDNTSDFEVRLGQEIQIKRTEFYEFMCMLKESTLTFIKNLQNLIDDCVQKKRKYPSVQLPEAVDV